MQRFERIEGGIKVRFHSGAVQEYHQKSANKILRDFGFDIAAVKALPVGTLFDVDGVA
jgi:hypothetical protein